MSPLPVVAIIVPCFNEEPRWSSDYWRQLTAIESVIWIFVDDGSKDRTKDLATQALGGAAGEVIRKEVNQGKGEAIRAGMQHALKTYPSETPLIVGFMDADGAFDPQEVERLIEIARVRLDGQNRFHAIWSSRVALSGREIHRTPSRHFTGRLIATLLSQGRDTPYDTQSGFKLFADSETLKLCIQQPFKTRWLFELEILSRWKAIAGTPLIIWEEPLNSWNDVPGSRITAKEAIRIAKEIGLVKVTQLKVHRQLNRRQL